MREQNDENGMGIRNRE